MSVPTPWATVSRFTLGTRCVLRSDRAGRICSTRRLQLPRRRVAFAEQSQSQSENESEDEGESHDESESDGESESEG